MQIELHVIRLMGKICLNIFIFIHHNMVEKEINKHSYTNKSTRHIENRQQSINVAGIHLNGKIYIKLSLISNGSYLNRYNTISREKSKFKPFGTRRVLFVNWK